jgi:hypothetical protein
MSGMPVLETRQQIRELRVGGVSAVSQALQRRSQLAHRRRGEPPGLLETRPQRGFRGHLGQARIDGQPGRQDVLDRSVVQVPGQAASLEFGVLLRHHRLTADDLGRDEWLRPERTDGRRNGGTGHIAPPR